MHHAAAQLGSKASFHQANVASYESLGAAFLSVWDKYGRLDAVVANAGVADRTSLYILRERHRNVEDIPPAPDTLVTDVNYKGMLYSIQLAIHFMRHNKPIAGGRIVAAASIVALAPEVQEPQYSGTKAGVLNLVRAAAPILKLKDNILLNAVLPGTVQTPLNTAEFIAAVDPASLTPMETVIRAYEDFLEEELEGGRAGEGLECSAEKVIPVGKPPVGNGKISEMAVLPWDKWFRDLHGETSGLDYAIPG